MSKTCKVGILLIAITILLSLLTLTSCGPTDTKELVSVDVIGIPEEGVYIGEFDDANIRLNLNYDDGSSEIVQLLEKDIPADYVALLHTPGEHTIEMLYRGMEISYTVKMKSMECKITFVNLNDEDVKTITYNFVKKTPEIVPPTADEMAVPGYRFTGEFDKSFEDITENTVIKGIYVKTYNVKFLNALDEVVSEQNVDEGGNAIAPSAEEMACLGYNFTGEFDTSFEGITEDTIVKGIYGKTFVVTFYNGKNQVISVQQVEQGADAVEPTYEERLLEGYIWKSWDRSFTNVQKDLSVYGVYVKGYSISYSSFDETRGTVSCSINTDEPISAGTPITLVATPADGYIFTGWYVDDELVSTDEEYDFVMLTKSMHYVAKFNTICEIVGHTLVSHAAKQPTCTEVGWDAYAECSVCGSTTYKELPALGHNIVSGECTKCDYCEYKITLNSNTSSVLIQGATTYKVVLYAEVKGSVSISTVGIYGEDGTFYGLMYDDGKYSENGDELSNDNVYTLIININVSNETTHTFVAKANNSNTIISNEFSIDFIKGITEEELDNMEEVDEVIDSGVFEQDNFDSMTTEEKKEVVEEQLQELEKQELITSGSVIYNENTSSFTFQYESGALGAIVLEALGDGTELDLDLDLNKVGDSSVINKLDAIVLWSFGQAWDDPIFRKNFYVTAVDEWNKNGVDSTVDWDVTIEDYKNLSSYEIIVLSAHGAYYEYKTGHVYTEKLPSIILCERATKEKDKLYAEDLKMHRIGKISVIGGTMYTILPDFWTYYYGAGALDGSFVFSESCEFAGINDNVDEKMFDAILAGSAESVIGFHNSVAADYSRNLMNHYISALIAGYDVEEAFEMAKDCYGENDYFPGREFFGPTAYPVLRGNLSAVLISSTLENGSFEDYVDLSGWEYEGDVRVLTKLGDLEAQDEHKMAILTTGIGSGESGYLEATEGSILYQTFYIGSGHTTLSFFYNVVSEEPHEYVGSKYDDKFYVEIVSADGNKYTIAAESVNASNWTKIGGINFDGGDETTYETGWKFVEYDISAFQDQYVTLRFITYDVGDSIYDTAALIDSVTVH